MLIGQIVLFILLGIIGVSELIQLFEGLNAENYSKATYHLVVTLLLIDIVGRLFRLWQG